MTTWFDCQPPLYNSNRNLAVEQGATAARSRFVWTKRFAVLAVLLGLGAYSVVASSWFFNRFVIERISSALACRISAERMDWSPASGAQLRGVKVTAMNGDPIATIDKLDLTFANPIWHGGWVVTEIQLDRPSVRLNRVDGVTNVDSIRGAIDKLIRQKKAGTSDTELWAARVKVHEGEFQLVDARKGVTNSIACSGMNITGAKVDNRRDFHIGGKAAISLNTPTNDLTGERIQWSSTFAADISLMDDFSLGESKLDTVIEAPRFGGRLFALNATRITVNASGKGNAMDRLRLRVTDPEGDVADFSGSGQFNWRTLDGSIEFETQMKGPRWNQFYPWLTGLKLDADVVRIRGAAGSDGGKQAVVLRGEYKAESARVFLGDAERKGLELAGAFAVDLRAATGLRLDEISCQATRPDGAGLAARLMGPWGVKSAAPTLHGPKWRFVLNDIPIGEIPLVKTNWVCVGKVNADVVTTFGLENGMFAFDGSGEIREFGTTVRGHSYSNLLVAAEMSGRQQSSGIKFDSIHLESSEGANRLLRLDFSGELDAGKQSWDGTGAVEILKSGLKHITTATNLPIEFTRLFYEGKLKVALNDKLGTQTNSIIGKVEFEGSLLGKQKRLMAGRLTADASFTSAGTMDVRDVTGSFTLDEKPAATLAVSGNADLKASPGKLTVHHVDLGRPILEWIRESNPSIMNLDAQSVRFDGIMERSTDGRYKAGGNLHFNQPKLNLQPGALAVTSCEMAIELEFGRTNAAWTGSLANANARFLNDAKPVGQLLLDGNFEDNARRGHVKFRAVDVGRPLWEPWIERFRPSIKVAGGKLQASGNWNWAQTNRLDATGKIDSFGIQVGDRKSDGVNLAVTFDIAGRFPGIGSADQTSRLDKVELGLSGAANFSGNIGGAMSNNVGRSPFAIQLRKFEVSAGTVELFSGINFSLLADDQNWIKPREVNVAIGPGFAEFHKWVLPLKKVGVPSDATLSGRLEWNDKMVFFGKLLGAVPLVDFDELFSHREKLGAAQIDNSPTRFPLVKQVPLDGLALSLVLAKTKWKAISLTNVSSQFVIRPTSIEVRAFQASLNDAPISGGAVLRLPLEGSEHSIQLETKSLQLSGVAAAFGGTNGLGRLGNLTLKADLTKVRLDPQSFLGSLSGRVIAFVEGAEMQLDGPFVGLGRIPFELIRAPEILKEPIHRIESDITFDGGTVTNEVSLITSAWTAFTSGRMKLTDRWQETAVAQPVRFSLSSVVAKKFKVPLLERRENFRELRSFYSIGGTIENPDFKINYPVAVELFTQATVRRVLGLSTSFVEGAADTLILVPRTLLSPILKQDSQHLRMLNPIRLLESIRNAVLPPKSKVKQPR